VIPNFSLAWSVLIRKHGLTAFVHEQLQWTWVGETFSKRGAQVHVKKYRKNLWIELATVTSQALKYDVITYAQYEGLNYTVLNEIKPL